MAVLMAVTCCESIESSITDPVSMEQENRGVEQLITFSLYEDEGTKAPTPLTSLSSFKVSATSGAAGSETSKLSNVAFTSAGGGKFTSGVYWPSTNPNYSFYASNAQMTHTAAGQTVTISSIDLDVVCAYLASANVRYREQNTLVFNHILARVGTVTFVGMDLCSDFRLSMKYSDRGTYNLRTKTWTTDSQATKELTVSDNNFWIIPGTYEVTMNYKDGNGNSRQKKINYTFEAGKVNNIIATLGDDVLVKIDDPVVDLSYSPSIVPAYGSLNGEGCVPTLSYSQTLHYASGDTTIIREGGEISYKSTENTYTYLNKESGRLVVFPNEELPSRQVVITATVAMNGKTGQGTATVTQQGGRIVGASAPEFRIFYSCSSSGMNSHVFFDVEGGTAVPAMIDRLSQEIQVVMEVTPGVFKPRSYQIEPPHELLGNPQKFGELKEWLENNGGSLSFKPLGGPDGWTFDTNGGVTAEYNRETHYITSYIDVTLTMNGVSTTQRVQIDQGYSQDPIISSEEPYISQFTYDPSVIGANGGTARPTITCLQMHTHKSGKTYPEVIKNYTVSYTGAASGFTLDASNGMVEAERNTTSSERSIEVTAKVTINGKQYSKTSSVLQNIRNDYSISVSPTTLVFENNQVNFAKSVAVNCPVGDWEFDSASRGWDGYRGYAGLYLYKYSSNDSETAETGYAVVRCKSDRTKTATINLVHLGKTEEDTPVVPVTYSISVNPTGLTFGSDAAGSGSQKSVAVTCPEGDWEISSTSSGWTAMRNGNNIDIYPTAANTSTTTAKTGTVTVRCKGDNTKTATVDLTQEKKAGGDTPVVPVTYSISVNPTSLIFASNAAGSGSQKSVAVTCPEGDWEISSTSSGWTASKSGNNLYVYPNAANTSTTTAKTGSVTVRCKGDTSKTATVNLSQEKKTEEEPSQPDDYKIEIESE